MSTEISLAVPPESFQANDEIVVDFAWIVKWAIDTQSAFNTNGAGIRSSVRIDAGLQEVRKGAQSITLLQEDFDRLKKVFEEPEGGYPLRPAYKLLPLLKPFL